MIVVDANLLIYARIASLPQHESAQVWLDEKLNGEVPVGIPWPSLLGFVRVMTNPRILERPLSITRGWQCALEWLELEQTWIPLPTPRHREILSNLFEHQDVRGDLVPDAHLAAIAIGHDLTLCSSDTDFARFAGLRWENPLAR